MQQILKIWGKKSKEVKQVLRGPDKQRKYSCSIERSKIYLKRWKERERESKTDRQSMNSPKPGPAAWVLLTCVQMFPPNCPKNEAVNGCV